MRGVIRDTLSGAPVGAAVVTVLDSAGASAGRTIADPQGRFSIVVPARAAKLRVLRIGYRPRELVLPSDRGTELKLAMEHIAPLLEAVRVSDKELCPGGDERGAAFQLWDQARAGLLATVVARESKPATTSVTLYEQYFDANQDRVRKLVVQHKKQTTTRPFVASAAPSYFAVAGYMVDGGRSGRVFNAPDADVILDESFARTHCFRRQSSDRDHGNQVGLAFTPAPGDGRDTLVDVRGTIWLDTAAAQIRSLDFTYTSLERAAMNANAGGHVEFRTVANGMSFIERWYLSLPILDLLPGNPNGGAPRLPGDVIRVSTRRQDRTDVRLVQVVQSGGVVDEAAWTDGTTWRDAPTGVKGVVTQAGSSAPLANAVVTLAGSNDTTTAGLDGAFTMMPIVPGKYDLVVVDTALREFVPERKVQRAIDVVHGQVAESNAQLGSFMDVAAKVCKGIPMNDTKAIVAGRVVFPGSAPRGAQIRSRWLADFAPVSNGATISSGEQLADLDEHNRFVVCGVAQDRKVDLRLLAGAQSFSDTSVIVPRAPFASVTWRARAQALAQVDPGRFTGTVVRTGTGQPIEGARVTLEGMERAATSKSDGTFELSGIAPGEYPVQVRHVGDGLLSDTIRIASGQLVRRSFELHRATALDTVRAIAAHTEVMSSRLRAFEDRRARGLGTFLLDTLIRKSESRRVGDLLSGYIPSIKIVTGKAGGQYAIVGRGMGASYVPSTFGDYLKPGCYVTVYYDGNRIYDPNVPNSPGVNLNDYHLVDMARIEFYAGMAQTPPEFGAPPCGVLALWSREK